MFELKQIGIIRSSLLRLEDCPLQESEQAPEATIELEEEYVAAVADIAPGDKLVVLTWFHLAGRDTLRCHRRRETDSREYGVFSTRSPERPNPIGIHTVTVTEMLNGGRSLRIRPMEALNGTPVIDIKPWMKS